MFECEKRGIFADFLFFLFCLKIFVANTLPPAAALMSQIYKQYAEPDGFLYISYSGESTFGARVPLEL